MKQKKEQIKEINTEVEVLKGQLARALADYDNLRKRSDVEKETWIKFAATRMVTKILPVIDMFEDAQKHLADAGLAIALGELKKVLYEEGLVEINSEAGSKFDSNIHEAIETIDGGEKDTIEQTLAVGWKFAEGNQVVRPAKVKVYKGEN